MAERTVHDDARRLELCADDLLEIGASIESCRFRPPTAHVTVPLQPSTFSSKRSPRVITSPCHPSPSLYSLVSSSAYAARTKAANHEDTWQTTLHRLALEIATKSGSNETIERCDRLKRRFEALSDAVRLCHDKMRTTGDEVTLQDRVERQLAQEEMAWEQQMQTREQRVAALEVELQALKEENIVNEAEMDQHVAFMQAQDEVEAEQERQAELVELQEAVALRVEEKRDMEAAVDSLQRKKRRHEARSAEARKKQSLASVDAGADAAASDAVMSELREEKEAIQSAILAAEEREESWQENVHDLPKLKQALAAAKKERAEVQTHVESLRLELAQWKRKMRHMVEVQLLTARDTKPPTVRDEAVLLHLLYDHEGEMGVHELKHEASAVLRNHGKPHGNGVVIRALYSLVANGLVQIDRSYGNGLVTSLLV